MFTTQITCFKNSAPPGVYGWSTVSRIGSIRVRSRYISTQITRCTRMKCGFQTTDDVEELFCFLYTQTFGYREMNFQCHAFTARVRVRAEPVAVKHVRSYSLYSKHLTRTQFCTRTNVTHIVIPLSLCKYTMFSKS